MKYLEWFSIDAVILFLAYLWSLLSSPTQQGIAYFIFGALLLLAIYLFSAVRFRKNDAV